MKKLLLLLLPMLVFTSCSIEEDETGIYDDPITDLNATLQSEGCDIVIVESYKDFGQIHVTNDNENLYITIAANDGYLLENIKLHIADNYSGFPTVGKGNLPPGQMDINQNYNPSVEEHSFSFSLNEYAFEDNQIYIASKADFTDGTETFSSWAGDMPGAQGNWYYMEYNVQECSIVQDPCENYYDNVQKDLCSSEVDNISLTGVRNYFKNQVFQNTGLTTITGTFNPTMEEMLALIEADNLEGTYTTNYTVITQECGFVSFDISITVSECP